MFTRNLLLISVLVSLTASMNGLADTTGVSFDPAKDEYNIINSIDQRTITAFGNDDMGLFSAMKTELSLPDGVLQKTRDTAMFSFGAEQLFISDTSFLAIKDAFGNQQEGGFGKSVLLTDCDIPFAMLQNDLIKLSNEGIPELADSVLTVLLATNDDNSYKADNIASAINKAFGDSSKVAIKTFKLDGTKTDIASMFETINFKDYYNSAQMNDLKSLFSDPEMWALLEEARNSQKPSSDKERDPTDWTDSFGGVSCRWGYSQ